MKVAVLTGAAIRIGKGIAEELLNNGYHLILHANHNFKNLQEWTSKSPFKKQIICLVKADLSQIEGQDHLCQVIKDMKISLDLLVHNASFFEPVAFAKISRAEYQYMQSVNLEAPFFITQSLLPNISSSKLKSVINICDALWERPQRMFSHYSVSKAGLAILTRALAYELAPDIRVNAVAPGAIMFQDFHSDTVRKKVLEQIPFKQLGTASDIAKMIIYLTENAPYVTGQIINVDGGRSIV